jgi:signal transduction histidine kinase
MEGSPVRGQQKLFITQLNACDDLQSFHAETVRLLGSEFKYADVFFGVVDASAKMLQLPVWIKSHLERHDGLVHKLEKGEMVGISVAEDTPMPRPASAGRSSVFLIPLVSADRLIAAFGLVSPFDGPQLSAEDIESARQLAYSAAAILTRLQEIERLRSENVALVARAERSDRREEELQAVTDDKNSLDAIIQMHLHQEVNVAHELRTPLAAIRGYVRMILDGRGGEINDKQREYLRIVTDNTNRLITLVGWMSYVSELSVQYLKLSTFDFRTVLNECGDSVQSKLTEKSLKLTRRIPEEPFVLIGDREKLACVVDDLLGAAVMLAQAGGVITVELSHGRDREINFKLSETGAEIPAEALSGIFERPFNTVTKPTAQNRESGVISLSNVYDIVAMHGGRVFVNSNAGRGATFLFTLPAITAGVEENSHEQAVNSGRRRR